MRENESYEFPVKTFPELLNHSRSWKNELRSMSTQNFSKLGLLRAETKQLNLFAIAAAPGSSIQTLYTTPVPIECVEKLKPTDRKLEMKMRPAYRAELFNRKYFRQTPPSAEFSLLCERQRSQVVTGITDYEIKPKIGSKMIMLSGDQLFKYNPENELAWKVNIGEPTAEPMEVSSEGGIGNVSIGTKGCSAEHATSASGSTSSISTATKTIGGTAEPAGTFISSAKLAPCDDKYMAYVLNKQVFIEYNDRLVFRTTSNSKHITNGVPSYIVQEELERFEGIWWSETAPRLLYEHVNEECVENAHFGINGEPASAPMKYPKAGKNNAVSTLRMVIFENDTCYDVALKPGVLEKVCPRFEYITRAGFFSDGSTVWVQLMSRDQSECSLVLIPITDFELPRELRDATPPPKGVQLSTDLNMGHWGETSHEETMEKPPRGKLCKTVVVHRARNEYWINVHNAIYPLKIKDDDQPLYEFIYCLEKPNGSCLALLSAELDDNGHCRHTEETLLMAETHSINKTVGIRVDEERELVYYAANESHPTEWNICVAHYRQRVHRQLTENGICFKSERAHMKLALDFDHGFAVWMTSVGSPPQCRFYGLRWTQGEILPKPFYAANITLSGCQLPADVSVESPEMIEYQSKRTGLIHYAMIIRPPNFDPNKKYPVFHYVYGGPGIQIVHNDFSWVQWSRFSRLGYVVVMLDNRGTAHRGIEFERHLSKKMGHVEVEDQVEGLQLLAEKTGGFMDMSRVVVHGWSYGGYMALHLIAMHPNIYRAALAGGAVSDWKLYDTAYTERYLGYPVEEHIYSGSSVNRLVNRLPDEPNRLMLIHGLMDENVHFSHLKTLIDGCVRSGKWHELLLFPHERHGIRNNDSSIYLDARMMYFAQRAITDPMTIPSGAPPSRDSTNSSITASTTSSESS